MAGDLQGGGAGVQYDDVAVFHQAGGQLTDLLLGAEVHLFTLIGTDLEAGAGAQNGAAVGACQHTGVFQNAQIGADGGAGDVKARAHFPTESLRFSLRMARSFSWRSSANMLTHSLLTGTMDVRLIYPAYRRQAKRLPAAAGNIPPGVIRARCEGYGASILLV